jgi:hypothetical protein
MTISALCGFVTLINTQRGINLAHGGFSSLTALVAKPFGLKARQMSHAISALVAENALLHQENSGLKETIANEKKRRQRGKPLLLQPPENYDGGAIFWSPQKVKEARIQQEQKELMEEEAQHQKDEANRLKAEK